MTMTPDGRRLMLEARDWHLKQAAQCEAEVAKYDSLAIAAEDAALAKLMAEGDRRIAEGPFHHTPRRLTWREITDALKAWPAQGSDLQAIVRNLDNSVIISELLRGADLLYREVKDIQKRAVPQRGNDGNQCGGTATTLTPAATADPEGTAVADDTRSAEGDRRRGTRRQVDDPDNRLWRRIRKERRSAGERRHEERRKSFDSGYSNGGRRFNWQDRRSSRRPV